MNPRTFRLTAFLCLLSLPAYARPEPKSKQSKSQQKPEWVLTWSDEFAPKILQTLAATDSEFVGSKEPRDTLFRRAERLVIALDRLFSAVYGPLMGTSKNNHLAQLFDDLKSRSDFNAAIFANHLSSFRATIAKPPR